MARRGLPSWSKFAQSQSRARRQEAENKAHDIAEHLRYGGNWRIFVNEVVNWSATAGRSKLPQGLIAEAIIRELENTSLEDIVMKNMLGGTK